jgi:hypothetical protein
MLIERFRAAHDQFHLQTKASRDIGREIVSQLCFDESSSLTFVQRWRQLFLEEMQPKCLMHGWAVGRANP